LPPSVNFFDDFQVEALTIDGMWCVIFEVFDVSFDRLVKLPSCSCALTLDTSFCLTKTCVVLCLLSTIVDTSVTVLVTSCENIKATWFH